MACLQAALHDIRASAQRLKVPLGPSDAPLAGHYHKLQELLTQLREVADKAPGPAERGEHKFASVCLQVMKVSAQRARTTWLHAWESAAGPLA